MFIIQVKYFNARSLRSKISSLHSTLYNDSYDVICITESWLNDFITDGLLDPRGLYNIYRRDKLSDHPSGGVCIFVKRVINSSLVHVDYNLYAGAEVCACNIYDNLHVFCTIICCYLAPGISNESFSNSIKCLHQLCLGGVRPLLLGDYNLPNINWVTGYFPSDFKYKVFFDFYSEFGFYQFIHESTRGSNVLDLLLTNDPLLLSS